MKRKTKQLTKLIIPAACACLFIYWCWGEKAFYLGIAATTIGYGIYEITQRIVALENKIGTSLSDRPSSCFIHTTASFKVDYVRRVMDDLGLDSESCLGRYRELGYDGGALSFNHVVDLTSGLDLVSDDEESLRLPYEYFCNKNCFTLGDIDIEKLLKRAEQTNGRDSYSYERALSDRDKALFHIRYWDGEISFYNHYYALYSQELPDLWRKSMSFKEFPYYEYAANLFGIMKDKADNNQYFHDDLLYDAFYGYTDFNWYHWNLSRKSTEELMEKLRRLLRKARFHSWDFEHSYDSPVEKLNFLLREAALGGSLLSYLKNRQFSPELEELRDGVRKIPEHPSSYHRYLLRRFNRLLLQEIFPEHFSTKLALTHGLKNRYPQWDIRSDHNGQLDDLSQPERDNNEAESERTPCSDGNCIGIINEEGYCGVCGKRSDDRRIPTNLSGTTVADLTAENEPEDDGFFDDELTAKYGFDAFPGTVVFESFFGQIRVEIVTAGPDRYKI